MNLTSITQITNTLLLSKYCVPYYKFIRQISHILLLRKDGRPILDISLRKVYSIFFKEVSSISNVFILCISIIKLSFNFVFLI